MTFQVEEALAFPAWKGPLHAQHDRRHGPTPGMLHVKLPTSGAKRRPSKLPGGKVVPPRTSRMAWEFSETAAKARNEPVPAETGRKSSEQGHSPGSPSGRSREQRPWRYLAIHLPFSLWGRKWRLCLHQDKRVDQERKQRTQETRDPL